MLILGNFHLRAKLMCGIVFTMANIKSSKKRIKVAETKRAQNQAKKSEIKTYLKKFKVAVLAKEKTIATELMSTCTSLIDVASQNGIFHANKAARMKAKLAKELGSIQVA